MYRNTSLAGWLHVGWQYSWQYVVASMVKLIRHVIEYSQV